MLDGDARVGEPGVEALGVGARDVEADETRIDTAFAQRRQQPEQVLLGAGDAGDLCRWRPSRGEQASVEAIDVVDHALETEALAHAARRRRAAIRSRKLRVTRELGEARRKPAYVADSREEASLAVVDDRRGAAGARRDDGLPRRKRLDRGDRRALVRRRETEARRTPRTTRRMSCW